MGIGTLRRYHKPLTVAGAGESSAPAEGTIDSAAEAEAAAQANAENLALNQQEQANAANERPNTTADNAEGAQGEAESVNPIVQEAGGQEAGNEPATVPVHPKGIESENGAEHDEITQGTPVTPGNPHGGLDVPTRQGSTDSWIAYAQADESGAPFDLTKRTGLRDDLAAHYLGAG